MNPLTQINKYGQSVWLDQMRRSFLQNGDLQKMIARDDLRGVTSNPTIFEKAIGASQDYDEALGKLAREGASINDIYEALVVEDIQTAADIFKDVYEQTNGVDGYISLEVSPALAHDAAATFESAQNLFARLDRPNAMIKIPATPEGLTAIENAIADGINVNVTLIFSQDVYAQVAESYIRGLERRAEQNLPIDKIASVASFFVSRIDTTVDKQLQERITNSTDETEKEQLNNLLGKTAVANAKLAYQKFKEIFASERFERLKQRGAKVQRPLWASTSVKNPAYSDVLYVESLIGQDTVNTMPPETIDAFRDHGEARSSIEENVAEAEQTLRQLAEIGISLDEVTTRLTTEGVKSFSDSFDKLIKIIEERRAAVATTGDESAGKTAKV